MTGLSGLSGPWFFGSAFSRRPLAYLFSRSLLEDRFDRGGTKLVQLLRRLLPVPRPTRFDQPPDGI